MANTAQKSSHISEWRATCGENSNKVPLNNVKIQIFSFFEMAVVCICNPEKEVRFEERQQIISTLLRPNTILHLDFLPSCTEGLHKPGPDE